MSKIELEFEKYFIEKKINFIRNDKSLFGTPDFSFHNGNVVFFINGCFWHGHNCKLWKTDKIWRSKIQNTIEKDFVIRKHYFLKKIKHIVCWECDFYDNKEKYFNRLLKYATDF